MVEIQNPSLISGIDAVWRVRDWAIEKSWEAGKLGSWEAGKLGSWEAEKEK